MAIMYEVSKAMEDMALTEEVVTEQTYNRGRADHLKDRIEVGGMTGVRVTAGL